MKRSFFLILAVLTTCEMQRPIPVHAQALTPELVSTYAALGAVVMAKQYIDRGNFTSACTAVRHQIELAAAVGYSSPDSIDLRNRVCNR